MSKTVWRVSNNVTKNVSNLYECIHLERTKIKSTLIEIASFGCSKDHIHNWLVKLGKKSSMHSLLCIHVTFSKYLIPTQNTADWQRTSNMSYLLMASTIDPKFNVKQPHLIYPQKGLGQRRILTVIKKITSLDLNQKNSFNFLWTGAWTLASSCFDFQLNQTRSQELYCTSYKFRPEQAQSECCWEFLLNNAVPRQSIFFKAYTESSKRLKRRF